MDSEESYGIKVSKDMTEPQEFPSTWLLRPGLYKITKAGEPYNTSVNFTTVRLLPGTLTQYTLVIDDLTENFIGAGILEELEIRTVEQTHFTSYSAINGSVNITSSNQSQKDDFETNINLSTTYVSRFQYDSDTQYFLSEPSFELVLNKSENQTMRINTDKLLFNNLYIYYFVPALGIYGRFDLETKISQGKYYFDATQPEIVKVDNGDTLKVLTDVDEVTVSPSFSPLYLKESLGINLTPVRGNRLRFSLRSGLGFWQYFNEDVYIQNTGSDVVFDRIDSEYIKGLEIAAQSHVQPTSKLVWSTKLDVLFPFRDENDPTYEFESLINFRLMKYTSLEYKFIYTKGIGRDYGWIENNLWLKLSYIF
jgi:hypothetical protein